QAGHKAVAEAMTHLVKDAPELERLDSERRAEARRKYWVSHRVGVMASDIRYYARFKRIDL
ncbi:MAG: hypothetical protein ACKODE_04470, partial [Acidimicrobiaceae bacterium]